MDLESQSWEYASEMVLKSVHLELRTGEVPVRFLKDPEGRVSHHRRMGWFSPFQAAWINLRAMFIYGADFFVSGPGIVLLALGAADAARELRRHHDRAGHALAHHRSSSGRMMAVVGLQGVLLGASPRFLRLHGPTDRAAHAMVPLHPHRLHFVGIVAGVALVVPLVVRYLRNDLALPSVDHQLPGGHRAVPDGGRVLAFRLHPSRARGGHRHRTGSYGSERPPAVGLLRAGPGAVARRPAGPVAVDRADAAVAGRDRQAGADIGCGHDAALAGPSSDAASVVLVDIKVDPALARSGPGCSEGTCPTC